MPTKKPKTQRVRSLAERRKFHLEDVKKGFRDPRNYNLTEKGKIHYGHIPDPNKLDNPEDKVEE